MYSQYQQYPQQYQQYPQQYLQEKSNLTSIVTISIIILLAIGAPILYGLNSANLFNIEGVWQYTADNGIDSYEITIQIDEETKRKFQVVGKVGDGTGFLAYGSYPFLYVVSLYPINNPIAILKLKFIPYLTNDEFYLTLEKPGTNLRYKYKRIEKLSKVEETVVTGGKFGS